MDDDLGFASVWQDTTPRAISPQLPEPTKLNLSFEEAFDDKEDDLFQNLKQSTEPTEYDDFGDDFGDFGDAQTPNIFEDMDSGDFQDVSFAAPSESASLPPDPGPSSWQPLRLHPMPTFHQLSKDVEGLLEPIYGSLDPTDLMSGEGIRQAEGNAQILISPNRLAHHVSLSWIPY